MRKVSRLVVVLAVMVSVGWMASPSRSQQKAGDKPAQQLPPGMTAEMMANMQKLATPGPQHETLKMMAGKFDAECTMVMGPGQEQKSAGVSTNEMVLGGRFLHQSFEGTFMGDKFQGIGLTGFDNQKQKYIGTWMDSMGTMMMVMEGTADASGKVITTTATMQDPGTGQVVTTRQVVTIVSNDKHTFDMYMPGPDGKEMKCMTIAYSRAK